MAKEKNTKLDGFLGEWRKDHKKAKNILVRLMMAQALVS